MADTHEHDDSMESNKKGKAPAKSNSKRETTAKKSTARVEASEEKLLNALTSIQSALNRQDNKMKEQSELMNSFTKRLEYMEGYDPEGRDECEMMDYYDEPSCSGVQSVNICSDSDKRKADEPDLNNNNSNKFHNMSKRFKVTEKCDMNVDSVLAENVNELFVNGIEEEKYAEVVKDDAHMRPENCESLSVVRMNQLIWDAVSPIARTNDKKLQNIETSVIKSAILLTKVVNTMAQMEGNEAMESLLNNCNDSLALLGHANKQINMVRKDFLRPELKSEYSHLCSQSRPVTKFLFGDDVSKSAKEIEDCSKISFKMFQNRPFRGQFKRGMMRGRFRGNFQTANRFRGRGRGIADGMASYESKNYRGRGSRPTYK